MLKTFTKYVEIKKCIYIMILTINQANLQNSSNIISVKQNSSKHFRNVLNQLRHSLNISFYSVFCVNFGYFLAYDVINWYTTD